MIYKMTISFITKVRAITDFRPRLIYLDHSSWAASPYATMISLLHNYGSFISTDFPNFCLDVYKVVCCRFVECGTGLNNFFSFHNVFKSCLLQMCQHVSTNRKGLLLQQTTFKKPRYELGNFYLWKFYYEH